jgi:hypothetical protein
MTITINLKGRLGNQLFQYATLRNISLKKGYTFYIDTTVEWHGQKNLLNYFNISESHQINEIKYHYFQPQNSNFFDSNIYDINDDTMLDGHFENVEYFKENAHILKNELTIKDKHVNDLTYRFIDSIVGDGTKLVGIHFRRGDVVQELPGTAENFNEFSKQYVYECLQSILSAEKNITLLIFTGGTRKAGFSETAPSHSHSDDLRWVESFTSEIKSNFNIHIDVSPGTLEDNEILDYCLMSRCDYLISPYISTFSFMASYVNKNLITLFTPVKRYGDI